MISSDSVMALVREVCPGFPQRLESRADPKGSQGLYEDLTKLATYIVSSYPQGKTQEFPALFELVEHLLSEGDAFVQEAMTVGLIEDVQNLSSHEEFGPAVFEKWLGPLTRAAWTSVQQSWEGKPSLHSLLRAEEGHAPRPELIPDISKISNPELAGLLRTIYRNPVAQKKKPWWKFWRS